MEPTSSRALARALTHLDSLVLTRPLRARGPWHARAEDLRRAREASRP